MKKSRLLTVLSSVLVVLVCILAFAACGEEEHTHSYANDWSNDGTHHWQNCSGCDETRNKAEHDWNEGVVTQHPTETSEGIRTFTCNTCGKTRVEAVPMTPSHTHTFSEEWSFDDNYHWLAPTCEHAEEKKDYAEHTWNAGEVTTQPTTEKEGIKTYTCETCSKTRTESVPMLEEGHVHTYNRHVATATYLKDEATCVNLATYYCSCSCGAAGKETFEYGSYADHEYSSAWSKNETHHWHAAICEHNTERGDYAEHIWDNGVVTTLPTTDSEGVKTYTCETCSKTRTESVPALEEGHAHIYDQEIAAVIYLASEATCSNAATYFYSCSCGAVGEETFEYGEVADHEYSAELSYNDTHHWYAAICKHSAEKKDYAEHTWNTGEITTHPTVESDGVKTFTCEICSKTKTESLPKLEDTHTHVFDRQNIDNKYKNSSATCTNAATYFYSCSCGASGDETFEFGDLKDHSFTNYIPDGNATCVKDGTKTAICDECNTATNVIADVGSATGHTYSDEWESDEEKHWRTATCEHDEETAEMGAHRWDEGVITKEPTQNTEGEKTYTCEVCEKSRVEQIGKLDHVHTYSDEYSTDDEYHWYSATCGHEMETNGRAPHDWDSGEEIKSATIDEAGLMKYTCLTCEYEKDEEIPVLFSYTVVFYDHNNTVLKTEKVLPGNSATPPADPNAAKPSVLEREGYRHTGWNKSYTNVNSNLDIHATYVRAFEVVFVDDYGSILDFQIVDAGENAVKPAAPERNGYRFDGWDVGCENVNSNLTVTAKYVKQYTVKFVDFDGTVLKTQIVDEGGSATAPIITNNEKYTVNGMDYRTVVWSQAYDNVESDITAIAQYTIRTFTVIFRMPDGTIIGEPQTVKYGEDAVAPMFSDKFLDSSIVYMSDLLEFPRLYFSDTNKVAYFSGWNDSVKDIKENKDVYAEYKTAYTEPVIFVRKTGNNLKIQMYCPDNCYVYGADFGFDWIGEGKISDCIEELGDSKGAEYNNSDRTFKYIMFDGKGITSKSKYLDIATVTFSGVHRFELDLKDINALSDVSIIYGTKANADVKELVKIMPIVVIVDKD